MKDDDTEQLKFGNLETRSPTYRAITLNKEKF